MIFKGRRSKFCMMHEYEKKIIGIILGFERKEKLKSSNNPAFSQNNIVHLTEEDKSFLCHDCYCHCLKRQVCSVPTLRKLENGTPFTNDCYYSVLSHKLGFEYELSKINIDKFNDIINLLMSCIITREKKNITKCRKELQSPLYYNHIYFSHFKEMFLCILNFITDYEEPSYAIIHLVEYIEPFTTEKTRILLTFLLFKYYTIYKVEMTKAAKYKDIILNFSQSPCISIEITADYLIHSGDNLKAFSFLYDKISDNKLDSPPFTKMYIYSQLTFLSLNLNRELDSIYFKKYKEIIQQYDTIFPDLIMTQYLNRLAVTCYISNKFGDSAKYFYNAAERNINAISYNFPLFYDAVIKSNFLPGIEFFKKSQANNISNADDKSVYIYYNKRINMHCIDKENASILEDYILNFLNSIYPVDSMHNKLMFDELKTLTSISKNYKKLNQFIII